jgi:membrane-associated phospholipid phosphatase
VGRHRPVLPHPVAHASGFSFPSGHATGSAALWGSVAVAVWVVARRLVVVALAVIVPAAVAATRVLLGVHFVTDVVAGLLVGWAVAAGLSRLAIGASPRTAGRASPSMARDRAG